MISVIINYINGDEMTIGKITKLIKDRGFGFITDDFGTLYFFHYSAINPKSSIKFDNLIEGMEVEFTGEPGDKGPRAKPRTLLVKSSNGNNNSISTINNG